VTENTRASPPTRLAAFDVLPSESSAAEDCWVWSALRPERRRDETIPGGTQGHVGSRFFLLTMNRRRRMRGQGLLKPLAARGACFMLALLKPRDCDGQRPRNRLVCWLAKLL